MYPLELLQYTSRERKPDGNDLSNNHAIIFTRACTHLATRPQQNDTVHENNFSVR